MQVRGVAAGLQALISLPAAGPGEEELLARAVQHGLALQGLGSHWHQAGDHPQGIVVGYGTPSERAYQVALEALARVLHSATHRAGSATRG
jgi:GntR family transcriptional regulator/MocR family aminotransferase